MALSSEFPQRAKVVCFAEPSTEAQLLAVSDSEAASLLTNLISQSALSGLGIVVQHMTTSEGGASRGILRRSDRLRVCEDLLQQTVAALPDENGETPQVAKVISSFFRFSRIFLWAIAILPWRVGFTSLLLRRPQLPAVRATPPPTGIGP